MENGIFGGESADNSSRTFHIPESREFGALPRKDKSLLVRRVKLSGAIRKRHRGSLPDFVSLQIRGTRREGVHTQDLKDNFISERPLNLVVSSMQF